MAKNKLLLLAGIVTALAFSNTNCYAEKIGKINLQSSFEKALDSAAQKKQNIILYFGSPHCHWCRKLTNSTLPSKKIQMFAERFQWVKVDTNSQPVISGMFQIESIPVLLIINPAGQFVAQKGFSNPDELAKFLQAHVEVKPFTPPALLTYGLEKLSPIELTTRMIKITDMLGKSNPAFRKHLLETSAKYGKAIWKCFLPLLSSRSLATRAAAFEALAYLTKQSFAFDPFADAKTRAAQIKIWTDWINKNAGDAELKPIEKPATPSTENSGEVL